MQTYNCLCNVGNANNGKATLHHEVPRYRVTAAEIKVMQSIHGEDAISRIKMSGEISVTQAQLRARLNAQYGEDKVSAAFGKFGDLPTMCEESQQEADLETPDHVPDRGEQVIGGEVSEAESVPKRLGRPPKVAAA